MNVDLSCAVWRKSTRSGGAENCVEVAENHLAGIVAVRDSKDRTGPVVTFNEAEWSAFVDEVKNGTFDT